MWSCFWGQLYPQPTITTLSEEQEAVAERLEYNIVVDNLRYTGFRFPEPTFPVSSWWNDAVLNLVSGCLCGEEDPPPPGFNPPKPKPRPALPQNPILTPTPTRT